MSKAQQRNGSPFNSSVRHMKMTVITEGRFFCITEGRFFCYNLYNFLKNNFG